MNTRASPPPQRIRRTIDEVDQVFGDSPPPSFPKRKRLTSSGSEVDLFVHQSRWKWLDADRMLIRQRQYSAKLVDGGKHVGSFRMNEYHIDEYVDSEELFDHFDQISASLAELAAVLGGYWDNLFEITELGTVLELERAWVAPTDASRERFQAACGALLKLAPKRALLLLKAYPLEYEGKVTAENAISQARRQRALIRLYRRSIGAEPLPAPAGEEGWMYLIPERLRTELRQPTPTGY
ncbi:hypothetical protein [Novosphingobium ginsenosidimutans]|uniref:Uncharacterized protein n=1 Tax=Novosphingobium ginsenosidimutans TaxID=1176536 RepID=A0A5B8S512_9SPHN|nr:hypothetical protein [Novosphingobium ginsenosidimutans]QEA16274.1 hypothetical protein FRF71_09095 [Novosphingobium ginsenosidimutans]